MTRRLITVLFVFALVASCGPQGSRQHKEKETATLLPNSSTTKSTDNIKLASKMPEIDPENPFHGISSKHDDIRRLISVSGGNVMGKEMLNGLLNFYFSRIRKDYPDISEKTLNEIRGLFEKEADIDALIDKFIPIYDKYYTQDEIREIADFFSSPVGQKMAVNSRPVVMECMEESKEWGQKLNNKLMPRIKILLAEEKR